jgi:hypothetical protein
MIKMPFKKYLMRTLKVFLYKDLYIISLENYRIISIPHVSLIVMLQHFNTESNGNNKIVFAT